MRDRKWSSDTSPVCRYSGPVTPAREPSIVPVREPSIVPVREPTIVPVREPLVRDPRMVPPNETVANDKLKAVAMRIRRRFFMINAPSERLFIG